MVLELNILQEDKNKAMIIALRRGEIDKKNNKKDIIHSDKRSSLETTLIGTLAEVVFDRTFEVVCDAPWVVTDPKQRFSYDFKNHNGETIELKSTDKFYKPYVQVNQNFYERKRFNNILPKYFVFVQYEGKFNLANKITVLGYMPSDLIPTFPVDPMKTDNANCPSYHIEKSALFQWNNSGALRIRDKTTIPTPY